MRKQRHRSALRLSADQCLSFTYIDNTIPLLHKSKFQASSHLLFVSDLVRTPEDRFSLDTAHIPSLADSSDGGVFSIQKWITLVAAPGALFLLLIRIASGNFYDLLFE